ncbi:MAG: flagellar basal body L-ring protein FlgH [bacterium]
MSRSAPILGLLILAAAALPAGAAPVVPATSLFADHEAHKVGDILTVLIVESTQAQKSTQTKTQTGTQNTAGSSGRLDFLKMWDLNAQNQSNGEGSTQRSGMLQARITVRVTEIDANGLLIVEGVRSVKVNGEEERTTLHGAVRPRDIGPDNTVLSTFLSDATIEYSGQGVLANAERPGIITRVFNWLF